MFEKFKLSSSNKDVIINLNEIIVIEDLGFNAAKIITNGNMEYIVKGDISSILRKKKLLD